MKALDNADSSTFKNRAIHNAYVFVKENIAFQINLEKGELEKFLEKRLNPSKLKAII